MLSKIRQLSWEMGQSLAGDGMLLRLRNASIALVGAVAAVGLALTLFISQLGFPAVFSSPIPGNPPKPGVVHDAIALGRGPAVGSASPAPSSHPAAIGPKRPRHVARGNSGGSQDNGGRGGSHQVAVSPGTQSTPAASQPVVSVPGSAPTTPPAATPVPPASSPTPALAAVESPAKSGSDGQAKGGSDGKPKSTGPSTAKVTSDSSGKPGTSPKGPQVSKSDGDTRSTAKPSGSPAEKAAKDQRTTAPKPVAPPPPAPEVVSPAAAKEAADSGK